MPQWQLAEAMGEEDKRWLSDAERHGFADDERLDRLLVELALPRGDFLRMARRVELGASPEDLVGRLEDQTTERLRHRWVYPAE